LATCGERIPFELKPITRTDRERHQATDGDPIKKLLRDAFDPTVNLHDDSGRCHSYERSF
jgi:hypothetical protein